MKANNPIEDQGQLSKTLAIWQVNAPLPPRFQERVWQRIERAAAQPAANAWTLLLDQIAAAFARPRLAVSYVTVVLAVGLLAGYWQGQLTKARTVETLSARYVQMVDPYQTPQN